MFNPTKTRFGALERKRGWKRNGGKGKRKKGKKGILFWQNISQVWSGLDYEGRISVKIKNIYRNGKPTGK